MTPLTVALIHNLKQSTKVGGLPPDYYSECDAVKTIEAITNALRSGGHTVFPVEADRDLAQWLARNPVDVAFNIAEGFRGEAREARVPALLELLEIPYTGSGVLTLTLALDKARSKLLFKATGVPTPNFQLFVHPEDPLKVPLHYPLIAKPNREGSAKGIWADSVVHNEPALRAQIRKVHQEYAQEVLVEEFIEGMELTVGILGTDQVLPVLEIDFGPCEASGEFFYSWRMKEFQGNKKLHLAPRFWCPARLDPAVTQAVQGVALKAAKVLGCRDMARVDIRLSHDGIPYCLEVNPLPGLDPQESNLPLMAQAGGVSYEALILEILKFAQERRATSSHPLSKTTSPNGAASKKRALPGPGSHQIPAGAGSPEQAAGSPGSSAVAIRRSAKTPRPSRDHDVKEEDLGR